MRINSEKFEKTVKAMSASEIIMAMVKGLRNPVTNIKMATFGEIENGVCFGCAATNAICHISGTTHKELLDVIKVSVVGLSEESGGFVDKFECAINELREGWLDGYNTYAGELGIARIEYVEDLELPELDDDYGNEDLEAYIQLAEAQ